MHRGTSYIGRDEYNSNNNNGGPTIATSVSSSNTVLRGIGCLIFASTILFLLAPAPNTHEGGVGGGILRTVPEPSSSVNGIHNNNDNNNYNNNDPRERTRKLPIRIQSLLAQSQIVGGHLAEVKEGKKTVEEIIHGGASLAAAGTNNNDNNNNNNNSNPNNKNNNGGGSGIGSTSNINPGSLSHNHKSAPMTLDEITSFLTSFLKKLNSSNLKNKRATPHGIWAAYHLVVSKWLYPWDQEYLTRMPMRREEDDSMFVSVVSFRDEHCPDTLKGAFAKAKHPDKLFVGLVQQNCQDDKTCHSGVTMEDTSTTNTGPDPDCYSIFCNSNEGKHYCTNGHVRLLQMKESESLGPYMARYFASKLWMGEEWYMQIDSHMTFLQDWDALAISMLKSAPSERPVISHLPPPHTADLSEKMQKAAPRLCGPVFATSDLESQIIRLEGSYTYDSVKLDIPRFAPFVAAGYLVAPSTILRDVPFDPFLPYIFMGEEILLSARLWTAGYDMFSPTHSLVGHRYVRNNRAPKFWESLHRAFTFGVHNPLQMLVLNRVKTQLGYPESAKDMLKPKSLFTAVEQYSMGTTRSLDDYLKMVGLNMVTKEVTYTAWCETGVPPPGFEQYSKLYEM